MSRPTGLAKKIAVSVLAVTSLAMTGAGAAGADPSPSGHPLNHVAGAAKLHLCQSESRRLILSTQHQTQFAAKTAAYAALQASAQQAGKSNLARYWAQVVDHRDAYATRQKANLAARTTRAAKTHGLVDGRCS